MKINNLENYEETFTNIPDYDIIKLSFTQVFIRELDECDEYYKKENQYGLFNSTTNELLKIDSRKKLIELIQEMK